MKLLATSTTKTLGLALALSFAAATSASAAVTLRTAPFPGAALSSGSARCMVRNGGTTKASTKMTLFSSTGTVLATNAPTTGPDDADEGTSVHLATVKATFCECTVPNSTTFSCSFVYTNGSVHVVVPSP